MNTLVLNCVRRLAAVALLAGCVALITPATAGAQVRTAAADESVANFLFGAPRAWIGVRGSYLLPRAGGELFEFVDSQLTLGTSDFRAAGISGDVGFLLPRGLSLVVGSDLNRGRADSEYRHFIASNNQPIAQVTRLRQTSVQAGLRWSPQVGQRISRLAFVPRRLLPYVGAGVATTYYSFTQVGQFVDPSTFAVFNDAFASSGWATGPYAGGGVDLQLYNGLYVSFDARYTWQRGTLGSDFTGFDGIDLAGLRTSSGIRVIF